MFLPSRSKNDSANSLFNLDSTWIQLFNMDMSDHGGSSCTLPRCPKHIGLHNVKIATKTLKFDDVFQRCYKCLSVSFMILVVFHSSSLHKLTTLLAFLKENVIPHIIMWTETSVKTYIFWTEHPVLLQPYLNHAQFTSCIKIAMTALTSYAC